ncbi:hypothetical protein L9F63_013390, partial [Diploptera punctata]
KNGTVATTWVDGFPLSALPLEFGAEIFSKQLLFWRADPFACNFDTDDIYD